MRTALMILMGIVSILLTVAVLLQSSNGEGLSSTIVGAAAGMAGKKKAKKYEALLNKATIVLGALFVVITIVLLLIK